MRLRSEITTKEGHGNSRGLDEHDGPAQGRWASRKLRGLARPLAVLSRASRFPARKRSSVDTLFFGPGTTVATCPRRRRRNPATPMTTREVAPVNPRHNRSGLGDIISAGNGKGTANPKAFVMITSPIKLMQWIVPILRMTTFCSPSDPAVCFRIN